MSLSAKIRTQLINEFRAELVEHVQTMTDGLLALEQGSGSDQERRDTLDEMFRAVHSLKGAARAVGVTAVEQLAHAIEDPLDAMRRAPASSSGEPSEVTFPAGFFAACYKALDAIQAVQAAFESGETTPPPLVLEALAELSAFSSSKSAKQTDGEESPSEEPSAEPEDEPAPAGVTAARHTAKARQKSGGPAGPPPVPVPPEAAERKIQQEATLRKTSGDETIRVSTDKLDALMAQLSELLVTKIRAEQRLAQVRQAQEFMALWQKEWLIVRSAYSRLVRRARDNGGNGLGAAGPAGPSRWPWPATGASLTDLKSALAFPQRDAAEQTDGQRSSESLGRDNGTAPFDKDLLQLLDYANASQERLREMHTLMNNLARQYADDTMHMALTIDDLEQEVKRTRMLPLSTITGAFGRMVRDLAHDSGKEARLQIVGGDTELDKRVLEQIKDPLIHLLRNAVDHGIELPEQRQAAGKPRRGTITLSAQQLGKDVVISVSDDGAGLNLEAVRQAAARKGRMDAQTLTEDDLKRMIFNVGISTSPIITDISGRGVGLDVVSRNVEALHGRIDLDWAPGEGTTFTLTLPLTLTSSRGLLVRVSGELFAVRLNAIERIEHISPHEITSLEGHDTLQHAGQPVSLVQLSDVLELPPVDLAHDASSTSASPHHEARVPVVILAAAERRMAFAVDELVGEQEVVIKSLGKQLSRVGGLAGATVMGDGEVVLILNVADLIKLAMRGEYRPAHKRVGQGEIARSSTSDGKTQEISPLAARAQRRILVVDDSITTRTLEKNILEAAGYTVLLATDGREALSAIAAEGIPDLIVSDVAMPRMDGFELTQQIKDDAHTADVPVILVTSLDAPEDKTRGIEAGADAYIVKSSFDQNNLLETIEQLI